MSTTNDPSNNLADAAWAQVQALAAACGQVAHRCQHTDEAWGPHPGCKEFMAEAEVITCQAEAVWLVICPDYEFGSTAGDAVAMLVCDPHAEVFRDWAPLDDDDHPVWRAVSLRHLAESVTPIFPPDYVRCQRWLFEGTGPRCPQDGTRVGTTPTSDDCVIYCGDCAEAEAAVLTTLAYLTPRAQRAQVGPDGVARARAQAEAYRARDRCECGSTRDGGGCIAERDGGPHVPRDRGSVRMVATVWLAVVLVLGAWALGQHRQVAKVTAIRCEVLVPSADDDPAGLAFDRWATQVMPSTEDGERLATPDYRQGAWWDGGLMLAYAAAEDSEVMSLGCGPQ